MSVSHAATEDQGKWLVSLLLLLFSGVFFVPQINELLQPSLSERLLTQSLDASLRWRENFVTYFIAITLEATPYMILGAFLAALIEAFLPNEVLPRLGRKLGLAGVPVIVLMAPLFPVCECGVIPVARRLLAKGLPLPHLVAYLLAAPILNPIVLGSTYLAFYLDWTYPVVRGLGGFLIAILAGWSLWRLTPDKWQLSAPSSAHHASCGCGHEHAPSGCPAHTPVTSGSTLLRLARHVQEEFLEVIPYFLFGVFIASLMKTYVSQEWLFSMGEDRLLGPAAMALAAFVMSLCSEADAFVAASFTEFDIVAHAAFLVLGPMLDIKLLLMYRSLFRTRFMVRFVVTLLGLLALYLVGVRHGVDWLMQTTMKGLM
ncbi:MAG: permease [Magnetococcales bacterium]|nr:permease [Magnetococcales bacterium]